MAMNWADGAEARLRSEKRNLGLDAASARVLRTYIEQQARKAGKTIVTKDMVSRLADTWVCGEGEN